MTKENTPRPAPLSFERVTRAARETTLRSGGHAPTLIIDGSKAPVVLQLTPLAPSPDKRIAQMFSAGSVLAHSGQLGRLRRVYFISEAWLSTAHEGALSDLRPSQDPKRHEVLIVTGYTPATQRTDTAILEMIRDVEGVLRELRDFERFDKGESHTESPLLLAFVQGFLSRAN